MNLIVCIKQVPDAICRPEIAAPPIAIQEDGLVYIVNPFDLLALEQALLVRDLVRGKVTVLTMGPLRAEAALRACLARGADEAAHLCDDAFEGSDAYTTALVLSRTIAPRSPDLILCGAQTTDGAAAQVGSRLAELLGLPQATNVTSLELSPDGKGITIQRRLEHGDRELVECPLPAVVTVDRGAPEPRYPLLPLRKKARTAPIERLDMAALGLSKDMVGSAGSLIEVVSISTPRPKARKVFTPSGSLSAEERLRLLMSGGIVEKKGDFIEGSPSQVAGTIVELLQAEKVVH